MKIQRIRILEKKPNYEVLGVAFVNYPKWKGRKVVIEEKIENGVEKLIITEVKPMSDDEISKMSISSKFIRIRN